MSQTVTQNGVTYTSGQSYNLRSRNAKLILNAAQATKSATKGH